MYTNQAYQGKRNGGGAYQRGGPRPEGGYQKQQRESTGTPSFNKGPRKAGQIVKLHTNQFKITRTGDQIVYLYSMDFTPDCLDTFQKEQALTCAERKLGRLFDVYSATGNMLYSPVRLEEDVKIES